MQRLYTFCLCLLLGTQLFAQNQKEDTTHFDFFSKKPVFPLIYLDPLVCKTYGGIHVLYEDNVKDKGVFIPLTLGFSKPFFSYSSENYSLEIGLEAADYVQFEIVQVDNNTYMGGLYNNDYKASAYLSADFGNLLYRLRLFHISSHLGDDYMIRNQDFTRNDKSVNYEQIDLTIMKAFKNIEYYGGAGYIITPNAFRERLSFQGGFQFDIKNDKAYQLVGGVDIKSFQQNDFYPNIHSAIGTEYNHKNKPAFRIQLDFYHGHLPYSTHEYLKVTWIGISSNIEI